MAFNKRTWKGRQGTGLNKFSIDGATPVTVVNQPDSITEQGDALSAGNLNNLENRIDNAFEEIADGTQVVGKATADASGNVITDTYETKAEASDLKSAISAIDHRVQNLEQAKGDYVVSNYKDGSITPSGKGNWAVVEGLRGVSRVENQMCPNNVLVTKTVSGITITNNGDGSYTLNGTASADIVEYLTGTLNFNGHTIVFGLVQGGVTGLLMRDQYSYASTASVALKASTSSCAFAFVIANGTALNNTRVFPIITDLTLYFGGTIPSDADTIAEIQQNYPHLLTPSEYGVRIVDSSYSGVRAWGKNLISGYIAQEGFWNTDGWQATSGIKSSVKIPVRAGATYIGSFYDKQGNRINDLVYTPFVNEDDAKPTRLVTTSTITLTGNEKYLAVRNYSPQSSYITADNYAYQLEEGSSATSYSPYMENTLTLTFNGKSAGSVSEMYYPETGEQTKPIGTMTYSANEVREGTSAYTNVKYFYVNKPSNSRGINTGECYGFTTKYLVYPNYRGAGASSWDDAKCIGNCFTGFIYSRLYFGFAPNTTLEQAKAQIDGLLFQYELKEADPSTFVTPLLDNTLLTEAGGRMATVQTGTVVDGSFDMGFITL